MKIALNLSHIQYICSVFSTETGLELDDIAVIVLFVCRRTDFDRMRVYLNQELNTMLSMCVKTEAMFDQTMENTLQTPQSIVSIIQLLIRCQSSQDLSSILR